MKLFFFFSLLQVLNDSTAVVPDGPDVLGIFLGNVSPDLLIAGFLMALLGLSFRLMYQAMTRNPVQSGTPLLWSWKAFWDNKLKRILLNIGLNTLAIFFSIRFMEDMLGKPVTMLYCAGIGLSLDWLIRKIGKWKPESPEGNGTSLRAEGPADEARHRFTGQAPEGEAEVHCRNGNVV